MNQEVEIDTSIQTVRGMHDVLPEKAAEYLRTETRAREIFAAFGYREIRTPILEFVSLFERALGQSTDIVEKEMFTVKDRGDRLLCLRPEGTAGVVRAFIENGFAKKSAINKFFYCGPMFRAERPQKGRYREFFQIGSEYFGNEAPAADAETIQLVSAILHSAGIDSFEIQLNSIGCTECRPKYQQILTEYLSGKSDKLCQDCQKRMKRNPLRVLDCKIDRNILEQAPKSQDSLCENCTQHFTQLKGLLQATKTEFKTVPGLVRGLDYYTRTVFEIYATGKTGAQDALAAGGRYDTLVRELGEENVPAVGFALGIERVLNLIAPDLNESTLSSNNVTIFVAALGTESTEKSFQILSELRKNAYSADGVLNNQSLKSQMRLANSRGARFCVIVGEDELKEKSVTLRDLKQQSQTKVPMEELLIHLKKVTG